MIARVLLLLRLLLMISLGVGSAQGETLHVVTRGQTFSVNAGLDQYVRLDCDFTMVSFSLFGNPIFWKKRQLDEEEAMDINFMGNILKPFFDTNRLKVEFTETLDHHYRSTLHVTDVSLEDSGNYTCEIHGRKSTVLGSVNHQIFVRAALQEVYITTGQVSSANQASTNRVTLSTTNDDVIHSSNNYQHTHNSNNHNNWNHNSKDGYDKKHYNSNINHNTKDNNDNSKYHHDHNDHMDNNNNNNPNLNGSALGTDVRLRELTFFDGVPQEVRCVGLGGFPPPNLHVYLEHDDITALGGFVSSYSASLRGLPGMRVMTYRSERYSSGLVMTSQDDGKRLRCLASVPQISSQFTVVQVHVYYGPIIDCPPMVAQVGDQDVYLGCDVKARPDLTALYWVIDSNGTILGDGDDTANDYWTVATDKSDGRLETRLYMSVALPFNFRSYSVVAENSVGVTTRQVELLPGKSSLHQQMSRVATGYSDTQAAISDSGGHIPAAVVPNAKHQQLTLGAQRKYPKHVSHWSASRGLQSARPLDHVWVISLILVVLNYLTVNYFILAAKGDSQRTSASDPDSTVADAAFAPPEAEAVIAEALKIQCSYSKSIS